jgi:uncharacterized repeat protein (TIGR03803 family)
LIPPATIACLTVACPWKKVLLYQFSDTPDANFPDCEISFDASGNVYCSTENGGAYGNGTVFKLTRSGATWTETILHSFDGSDGSNPVRGVIFDRAGNLYGTAAQGANCCGTVFQLKPSGSDWIENTIHSFQGNDGNAPVGPLLLDGSGNLYGPTFLGGGSNAGTVFELSLSNDIWQFSTLYAFTYTNDPARGPDGGLVMDSKGNLYGTTLTDPAGNGAVFKLTPSQNGWIETILYTFQGGADGALPSGRLALDGSGNLYGTASAAGVYGAGVVWKITP